MVLSVTCFKEAFFKGSKVEHCSIFKTSVRLHSGTNLTFGGLELNTTFNSLIRYGCCPMGILSMGETTADNMDLYPAIVLYCNPS